MPAPRWPISGAPERGVPPFPYSRVELGFNRGAALTAFPGAKGLGAFGRGGVRRLAGTGLASRGRDARVVPEHFARAAGRKFPPTAAVIDLASPRLGGWTCLVTWGGRGAVARAEHRSSATLGKRDVLLALNFGLSHGKLLGFWMHPPRKVGPEP